jgi:hypothetical protein
LAFDAANSSASQKQQQQQPPQATIGLEYSFVRAPPTASRESAHVWEAGGAGAASAGEAEWLTIPLTAQRLPSAGALLFLDASRPAAAGATALRVLSALRKRADECAKKGGAGGERGSRASSAGPGHAAASAAGGGAGAGALSLPFPLIVVGARWDAAAEMPLDARRALLALLRLAALAGGGGAVVCVGGRAGDGARAAVAPLRAAFLSSFCGAQAPAEGAPAAQNVADAGATRPPLIPPGSDALGALAESLAGLRHAPTPAELRAACETPAGFEKAAEALARALAAALPPPGAASAPAAVAAVAAAEEEDLFVLFPEPAVDAACEARLAQVAAAAAAAKEKERRVAAEARAAAAVASTSST